MDYEKFSEEFMKRLKEELRPETVSLERRFVHKVNQQLDGVMIRYLGAEAAPTIYLNELYVYHQDGHTVEELAADVAKMVKARKALPTALPELTREAAEKYLYCAVINADRNANLLVSVPHDKIEDLAVIVRYRVGDTGSFVITNTLCRHLRMTGEEVLELAHRNTEQQTVQCKKIDEILADMMRQENIPEEYIQEMVAPQECPLYVLTSSPMTDGGAAVITNPKALEHARDVVGEEFYILPSSTQEVILVPKSAVPETQAVDDLKRIVKTVNSQEVAVEMQLSDHVYMYDHMKRRFMIADSQTKSRDIAEKAKSHARSR